MADYTITIQATCNGFDKIEQQLNRILSKSGQTISLNVQSNALNQQMRQIQNTMSASGKTVGANFGKGVASGLAVSKAPAVKQATALNRAVQKESEKASKDTQRYYSNLNNTLNQRTARQYAQQQRNAFKNTQNEYNNLQKQAEQILSNFRSKTYQLQDTQMKDKLNRYGDEFRSASIKYKSAFDNLKKAATSYDSDKSEKNVNRLIAANQKYSDTIKTLGNEFKIADIQGQKLADPKRVANFQRGLSEYYKANTKMHNTNYGRRLQDIFNEANSGTITMADMRRMEQQAANIKKNISLENLGGKSLRSSLSNGLKQVGRFGMAYGGVQWGIREVGEMFKNVRDVNSSMIELYKVSSAKDSDIAKYYDEASASAQKYGASINEVINSTADWSRLGYGLDDAKKLSDATTMLQKVGDNMTQETSSQGLISTLKGFSKEADEAEAIVDAANEVANTQPIDTAGIFSGLQRSASSLSAAGNTYQEAIAMITAANSVVQDPDSVGTAFKTMSMRIRGAETDLEAAGLDTEGMATSTAKLREEMIALSGIDIMKDPNTFKSTYSILDELADKWSELTDIQQASITELIAGKRQGNVMSALMQNWDIAEASLNSALNSEGSAERELGNYQKGLQYSLDKFHAQFQDMSNTLFESDFLKTGVEIGSGLMKGITKAIEFSGFGGTNSFLNLLATGLGIRQGITGGGKVNDRAFIPIKRMAYATGEFSSDVYELYFVA